MVREKVSKTAAMYHRFGLMRMHGDGVPQDHAEAAKWFKKAADDGVVEAQYNIGIAYAKGIGVPRDDEVALNYLTQAAERGFPEAQYNLGVAYVTGEGVRQDWVKAAKYFLPAAERGDPNAQFNIGTMYASGQGTSLDRVLAFIWLDQAAVVGVPLAAEQRDIVRGQFTKEDMLRLARPHFPLAERVGLWVRAMQWIGNFSRLMRRGASAEEARRLATRWFPTTARDISYRALRLNRKR